MRLLIAVATILVFALPAAQAQYLGNITANPYVPPSPPQPPGTFNNPYGSSGNSPGVYDQNGGFHGNLNSNKYDPNSVANPYGRYGSRYSSDSINNPYGQYGSRYSSQSPNNPYGQGLPVYRPNTSPPAGDGDDDGN